MKNLVAILRQSLCFSREESIFLQTLRRMPLMNSLRETLLFL